MKRRCLMFLILLAPLLSPAYGDDRKACALLTKFEVEQIAGIGFGEPTSDDPPPEDAATLSSCSWRTAPDQPGARQTVILMLRVAPNPETDAQASFLDVLKDAGSPVSETRVLDEQAFWSSRTTPSGVTGELHVFKDRGAFHLMVGVHAPGDDRGVQARAKALAALALARAAP